jgi:hypothetical protein
MLGFAWLAVRGRLSLALHGRLCVAGRLCVPARLVMYGCAWLALFWRLCVNGFGWLALRSCALQYVAARGRLYVAGYAWLVVCGWM